MASPSAPPGALPRDDDVHAALLETLGSLGPRYRPRTRHLDGAAPAFVNRLLRETSPYLLQHAHNPVDWHPWGESAFDAGRALDRPILLSIGYATCHWCHVMEEESFEDLEVARFINEHFVPVKVDREERPDVDSVYMAAVLALTGHGGWPMTIVMTPEARPFFGGTYFPARDGDRGTQVGFLTLLRRIAESWSRGDPDLHRTGRQLARVVHDQLTPAPPSDRPGTEATDFSIEQYRQRFDRRRGGLRVQQKFPSALPLRLLLRAWHRTGNVDVLDMARLTLEQMAAGGIHDHVAGGFHRYSTDPDWRVPHFEKMLYDNALLAVAYLEGGQALGEPALLDVAARTLAYLERDMQAPGGGFWSATDADSPAPDGHGHEGWSFMWTPEEVAIELGDDEELAALVIERYGVTARGTPFPENVGARSVLHHARTLASLADDRGMSIDAVDDKLRVALERLRACREEREPPLLDDKVLTSWNGLAISAFARGSVALSRPDLAETGARAAAYLLSSHMPDGDPARLLRASRGRRAHLAAVLDDYAFLCAGLLDLFEATGELPWLHHCLSLEQAIAERFEDPDAGGWFVTAHDAEALLVREKPTHDGAEPSGGSVHALTLMRLAALTDNDTYRERAERGLRAFADVLERSPGALSEMLLAVEHAADHAHTLVLVTRGGRERARPFLDEVGRRYLPQLGVVIVDEPDRPEAEAVLPIVRDREVSGDGDATAYLCEAGACQLPATVPAALGVQLECLARPRDVGQ